MYIYTSTYGQYKAIPQGSFCLLLFARSYNTRLFTPYYCLSLILRGIKFYPKLPMQNDSPVLLANKGSHTYARTYLWHRTIAIGFAQSLCHHLHPQGWGQGLRSSAQ